MIVSEGQSVSAVKENDDNKEDDKKKASTLESSEDTEKEALVQEVKEAIEAD